MFGMRFGDVAASGSGAITSIIQSIQPFTISSASASSSVAKTTISAVNLSNSIIINNGTAITSTTGGFPESYAWLQFNNSTTVGRQLGLTPSDGLPITTKGYVVEFTSAAIKSIQSGNITIGGTSQTATISAVNTANSFVIHCGGNGQFGGDVGATCATLELTNSTTVTANRYTSAGVGSLVQFFVVEFNGGYLTNVQPETITLSGTTTNATISAVTLNDTPLFFGGFAANGSGNPDYFGAIKLLNATTLQAAHNSGNNTKVSATPVQFVSGVSSVQTGSITIGSGVLTGTATITSVDTSKSVVIWTGTTSDMNQLARVFGNVALTNSTTVTATLGSTSGSGTYTTFYFNVVTFV